jgi:hypothetical protein
MRQGTEDRRQGAEPRDRVQSMGGNEQSYETGYRGWETRSRAKGQGTEYGR